LLIIFAHHLNFGAKVLLFFEIRKHKLVKYLPFLQKRAKKRQLFGNRDSQKKQKTHTDINLQYNLQSLRLLRFGSLITFIFEALSSRISPVSESCAAGKRENVLFLRFGRYVHICLIEAREWREICCLESF